MILKLSAAHLVPRSCFLQFVGILAEVIDVIFRRDKWHRTRSTKIQVAKLASA